MQLSDWQHDPDGVIVWHRHYVDDMNNTAVEVYTSDPKTRKVYHIPEDTGWKIWKFGNPDDGSNPDVMGPETDEAGKEAAMLTLQIINDHSREKIFSKYLEEMGEDFLLEDRHCDGGDPESVNLGKQFLWLSKQLSEGKISLPWKL